MRSILDKYLVVLLGTRPMILQFEYLLEALNRALDPADNLCLSVR